MVDYGLKDKVAIITGANNPQGIGAATAIAFAREGAKVVLTYKKVPREYDDAKADENGVDRYYRANAGDASEVEERLIELGVDYLVLEKDISDETQVREIFDAAVGRFGRVDVLVNNAATDNETGKDTIEAITREVIDDTFAVNVRGSLSARQPDDDGGVRASPRRLRKGHQPLHRLRSGLRRPDNLRCEQGDARSSHSQHSNGSRKVRHNGEQRCARPHSDGLD